MNFWRMAASFRMKDRVRQTGQGVEVDPLKKAVRRSLLLGVCTSQLYASEEAPKSFRRRHNPISENERFHPHYMISQKAEDDDEKER
jgi:hypothetical protein